MDDDYWFWQRYDALLYAEHVKDHPESDPRKCPWCENERKEQS